MQHNLNYNGFISIKSELMFWINLKLVQINSIFNCKLKFVKYIFAMYKQTMNQVSQFCITEKVDNNKQDSKTPLTNQTKYLNEKSPHSISMIQRINSNFKCVECSQNLSKLTQIKKQQIILQYEVQKLKQQISVLKRQNHHLTHLQYENNKAHLQKLNPSFYFKEDLQCELQQTKSLLQLHLMSKYSNINSSCLTVDLKKKSQELLLENVKLQQKLMIRDKIIEERGLFPLYHYDQRVLTLRKSVEFWFRRAEQQSCNLHKKIDQVRKLQKDIKKQVFVRVQQQAVFWQNQVNKLINKIRVNHTNYRQSQANQKHIDPMKENNQQKQNIKILIQDHDTISFQLNGKVKQKTKISKHKQVRGQIGLFSDQNICRSCVNFTGLSCSQRIAKSKNNVRSNNNTSKFTAKDQQKNKVYKNENKQEELSKKNQTKKQSNKQQDTSLIGQNFSKIEIKTRPSQKTKNKNSTKRNGSSPKPLKQINCQRCADRIL